MISYIEEIMKDFTKHDDKVQTSATTALDHLFDTREDEIFLEDT